MKNAVSPAAHQETALREQIERKIVDLADSLIAANPDERANLIWRSRTRADKVCTIPPGVDTNLFRPADRSSARDELGLDPSNPLVLFVGRIDPIKGLDTLLDGFAQIDPGLNAALLVVGGDLDSSGTPVGPLAAVADRVAALGLASRVALVGAQPQDRLPRYYAAADVVAVPSRYESFGLVAVEAMACARPVVASRSGGLIFTVEDEETGLLTPVGDAPALSAALGRLLSDPALAYAMGTNARASAERFSWPAVAAQITAVYRRLAAGDRANLCCPQEIYA